MGPSVKCHALNYKKNYTMIQKKLFLFKVVEPHLVVLGCQHLDHILCARVYVNVDISERKLAFFTGKQSESFSPRVSVYPWCHYLVVRIIPLSTMFEFTVKIIWYCGHMPMLILLVIKYFHKKRRIEKCMGAVYLLITLISLP